MSRRLRLVLAISSTLISACSMNPIIGEPVTHKMNVAGEILMIRQLTEGTWTANASDANKVLAASDVSTALLRKAIETASGCKVTDSDFSRHGTQFDAQVDCESNLSD